MFRKYKKSKQCEQQTLGSFSPNEAHIECQYEDLATFPVEKGKGEDEDDHVYAAMDDFVTVGNNIYEQEIETQTSMI